MEEGNCMKIVIGADHHGFLHKEFIKNYFAQYEWFDVGTNDQQRTDYPLYSDAAVALLLSGQVDCGILLCGSGGGMAIAANRHTNIYAVVVWNETVAQRCALEDNANVLVIPADFVSGEQAVAMIAVWLATEFKGGRYADRLAMIDSK
jgi:ribose 5-phosphate isomerase B